MKQVRLGGSSWQASSVALGIMRMNVLAPDKAANVLDSAYNDASTLSTRPIFMVKANPRKSLAKL